jgi:4-methyl-5(b-hydroxyethyl)-thiazole monophosphate biosynthesis
MEVTKMKVRVLFAQGNEEVEALTVVDLLRRAGIECLMVASDDSDYITSSHKVVIKMDEKISDITDDSDMIVLPGGIPGVPNLQSNAKVEALVKKQYEAGKYVAAICAAPTALGAFGILTDKKATCYPGMEDKLNCREVSYDSVVVDGNVITSRGLGTAIDFGLKLIEVLINKQTSDEIAKKIVYR